MVRLKLVDFGFSTEIEFVQILLAYNSASHYFYKDETLRHDIRSTAEFEDKYSKSIHRNICYIS